LAARRPEGHRPFLGNGSIASVQTLSRLIQRRSLYLESFAEPLLKTCRLDSLPEEIDDRAYSINVELDTSGKLLGASVGDLIEALAECLDFAVEAGWDTHKLVSDIGDTHLCHLLLRALTFLAVVPQEAEALAAWAMHRMTAYLTANAHDLLGIMHLIGGGIAGLLNQTEDPWIRFHTARFLRNWTGDVVDASSQLEAALLVPAEYGRMEALELTFTESAEALLLAADAEKMQRRLRQILSEEKFQLLRLCWGLALPIELCQRVGMFGASNWLSFLNGKNQGRKIRW
jgi:hypothetical protein